MQKAHEKQKTNHLQNKNADYLVRCIVIVRNWSAKYRWAVGKFRVKCQTDGAPSLVAIVVTRTRLE